MKVLVTAFLPFNKANNNFSMEVLNFIDCVDKVILDVLYDESYNKLKSEYDLASYDLIVAMGEARMRSELTLELYAKNIASCSLPDNNQVIKKDEVIIENGPEVLKTGLDINRLEGIVKLSEDAGKFVCNNIYYHLLSDYRNKSLFIHIPNCLDETMYQEYAHTIMEIIKKLK